LERRKGAVPVERHEITEALGELRRGEPGALDRLIPLVYADLARIAHRQLGLESTGHTLSTREVVHEAYLRLVDQTRIAWNDRVHFFALASRVIRHVLVDFARRRHAARRGGATRRAVSLEEIDLEHIAALDDDQRADLLVGLDHALERLDALDSRQARVVEYRFFGGMTEPETAEALGVTERTVARDWVKARGWLLQQLSDDGL
jgi:RNA polymerase sigma factor (TIGR02999 family)